jgi:transposase
VPQADDRHVPNGIYWRLRTGSPWAFSPFLYRYRNLVKRLFNKLKHFRAIATASKSATPTASPPSSSPKFVSGRGL